MTELKKIEIICIPCHRCAVLKDKIQTILQCIEGTLNRRMHCELIYYTNRKEAMREVLKSGYAISELPVTRINGEVTFTGSQISEQRIRMVLERILKY